MENKLKIGTSFLFISSRDIAGGANIAAYRIHKALIEQGYKSKMIVNHKLSNDDSVIEIESYSKIIIKNLIYIFLLQGLKQMRELMLIGLTLL